MSDCSYLNHRVLTLDIFDDTVLSCNHTPLALHHCCYLSCSKSTSPTMSNEEEERNLSKKLIDIQSMFDMIVSDGAVAT